jgi:hypothetical protein
VTPIKVPASIGLRPNSIASRYRVAAAARQTERHANRAQTHALTEHAQRPPVRGYRRRCCSLFAAT